MTRQHLRTTLLAALLCIACGSPALADDTDIFVGQLINPGQPNLLFLFDTSGSMNSQVVVADDYDPNTVYLGACSTDSVYWSLQGSGQVLLPDCALATFVNKDAFVCQTALDAFEVSGYYRDRYAQWDEDDDAENSRWTTIVSAFSGDTPTGEARPVDCFSDNGTHGQAEGGLLVYPADGGSGPWSETETAGFWDNTGSTYTFYSGNFLNYVANDRDRILDTRMEVLQNVATDLITSMSDINVGVMRFSASTDGGQVVHEVANVNTNRADLTAIIQGLVPAGSTPLAETLFEASQYYSGRSVVFGLAGTDHNDDPQPSVPESYDAATGNYISPITRECQRNFLVVLTDGQPVDDTSADASIEALPGFSGSCSGNCLDELAIYMNTADQLPGAGAPSGDQTVETFVIGFSTDQELLQTAATGRIPLYDENGDIIVDENGDPVTEPGYFVANDTMQLMNAFDSIVQAIETTNQSFASPAVSINTFDRFTNRDELYFSMFKPSELGQPHWDGNVKKYRLVSADGEMVIVDANGNAAVDDNGEIATSAQSFWSAEVDGADVTAGGVASRLGTERNVYTNLFGPNLTAPENLLASSNESLLATSFDDIMPVAQEDVPALADFARGLDENGNARKVLGDPLHSRPLVISYGGANIENEDLTLFFTTNDGYLHAVDPNPADGTTSDLELFSFVPKELLPNLPIVKENAEQAPGNFEKLYGLDGTLTRWIQGDNGNLQVDEGESAYVIFGMRRGGRNYYALNVTDRTSPRVAWTIEGGNNDDFDELGQTWGAAVVGQIRWQGAEKDVLFISGGYDEGHDNDTGVSETDTMGRALFIVDAFTGQRLWSASGVDTGATNHLYLANMTNSIPSDPRVLDLNQDGLVDRIYVGDTAAQMWRFDIFNDTEDDDATITGGRIADFSGDTAADNRRFFYPPSVTRVVDERYGSFLAIAAGTGFRADPLGDSVDDRFYVLRDPNVFSPQVDEDGNPVYTTSTEIDLLDITDNLEPDVADLNANDGWRLDLEAGTGEKALAPPISADNRIFFTTYLPEGQPLTCDPIIARGSGLLYELELISGAPVNYDDQPTPQDRYTALDQQGIPPAPVLVFTEPPCDDCDPPPPDDPDDPDNPPPPADPTGCDNPFSVVTMVVGTEVSDPNICNEPKRTYWYQEDTDQ